MHFHTEKAKGQTILKVKGKICLLASEYLCAHPSLIDLFRPDDLWSFSIPLTYGQAIDTKPIMPHVAALTGLRDLNLKANKADSSIIPYLEKLQKLQSLNISTTDITGDALAKYSGLKSNF